jgi:hypothetical protein
VDYTYRKYDRGTATYSVGYTPNDGLDVLSKLYTGPIAYTDPTTGKTGNYYIKCSTCATPSGLVQTTLTNPNWTTYSGVDITANKRFSNRWQLNTALTLQSSPGHTAFIGNPTGQEYTNDISQLARYVFKANGSYQFGWGIQGSANLNINDGATRARTVNGPGTVAGSGGCVFPITTSPCTPGTNLTYGTLAFQPVNTERFNATKLLDLGAQKVFTFRGGKNRLTLMLDAFNVFNTSTIQSFATGNLSTITINGKDSPASVVPPRVFRVGAKIAF